MPYPKKYLKYLFLFAYSYCLSVTGSRVLMNCSSASLRQSCLPAQDVFGVILLFMDNKKQNLCNFVVYTK